MKITKEFIDKGRGKRGGLTPGQVHLLGAGWNPPRGWEEKIIGTEIDDNTARLFLIKFQNPYGPSGGSTQRPDTRRYDIMRRFKARSTKGICK